MLVSLRFLTCTDSFDRWLGEASDDEEIAEAPERSCTWEGREKEETPSGAIELHVRRERDRKRFESY